MADVINIILPILSASLKLSKKPFYTASIKHRTTSIQHSVTTSNEANPKVQNHAESPTTKSGPGKYVSK